MDAPSGNPDIETFARRVAAVTTAEELTQLLAREMRPFGLQSYALGRLSPVGQDHIIYISTWPIAWVQAYAVNGYAAEDIVVQEALRTLVPFTWTEVKARRPGEAARVLAAAASFGWHDGFVVPIHRPNGDRGIVALAGDRIRFGSEDRARATAMSLCAYDRAELLFGRRPRPSPLSGRERDALALVAQGKEDADIAIALGITKASAHVYVERAKKRLGASTRAQAVALALSQDLI